MSSIFGMKKKKVEAKVDDVKVKKNSLATKTSTFSKTPSAVPAASQREAVSAKAKEEKTGTTKSKYSYRITEKATTLADKNVYVLNIPKNSNKTELKKDLEKTYKVTVLKINIVNSIKKTIISRGRYGVRGGGKKAYITLKAGDSIVL